MTDDVGGETGAFVADTNGASGYGQLRASFAVDHAVLLVVSLPAGMAGVLPRAELKVAEELRSYHVARLPRFDKDVDVSTTS